MFVFIITHSFAAEAQILLNCGLFFDIDNSSVHGYNNARCYIIVYEVIKGMGKSERLSLRECVLGDRAFYSRVLLVVLPIIVQNTLTNVVSLLDNVMVGQG